MAAPTLDAIAACTAMRAYTPPSLDKVWDALARVPDPELPVVSIVELGIVRDVYREPNADDEGALVVQVTPTYSGCPATDLIDDGIREAVRSIGIGKVRIDRVLAPAWTTAWIAPEAKAKLRDFGIAPPGTVSERIDVSGISPLRRRAAAVPCPRCDSTATSLIAQFGSTACKALYRCEACQEPFDYFKPF